MVTQPRALTFNIDPEGYDRHRPGYPAEVFAAIAEYRPLPAAAEALEIGIGTGQATRPMLDCGLKITAIDAGDRLVEFARFKFRNAPALSVHHASFESYQPDRSFDLIYSATAFHWVDRAVALPKAYAILNPGGAVALFWNHPRPDVEMQALMRPIYQRHRPEHANRLDAPFDLSAASPCASALTEAGFVDVCTLLFHSERRMTTVEYIRLLNTYSDHMVMSAEARYLLERDLAEVIDATGGEIVIHDTVDLHLGRLPMSSNP